MNSVQCGMLTDLLAVDAYVPTVLRSYAGSNLVFGEQKKLSGVHILEMFNNLWLVPFFVGVKIYYKYLIFNIVLYSHLYVSLQPKIKWTFSIIRASIMNAGKCIKIKNI